MKDELDSQDCIGEILHIFEIYFYCIAQAFFNVGQLLACTAILSSMHIAMYSSLLLRTIAVYFLYIIISPLCYKGLWRNREWEKGTALFFCNLPLRGVYPAGPETQAAILASLGILKGSYSWFDHSTGA